MPPPMFKEPRQSQKVRNQYRRRARTAVVDMKKDAVRRRDKGCRVPLCGCRRFGLQAHVAHSTHQGMGGNPALDRSEPETMIYVCMARHRENVVSLDRHTLAWEPLTALGSDGPVRWLVNLSALGLGPDALVEMARETGVGTCEPFTPDQEAVWRKLSAMLL